MARDEIAAHAKPRTAELLEALLALASFLFFRAVHLLWRIATVLASRGNSGHVARERHVWHVHSDRELDREPLLLPTTMINGPRWNTHAITAFVGPLEAGGVIEVEVGACRRSAGAWTVVLNRVPKLRAAGALDSAELDEREWASIAVEPGLYMLLLRYYRWSASIELPAVRVDGAEVVARGSTPSQELAEVYQRLWHRRRRVYAWMHYYVFYLLRHADRFPAWFVERELLPVGNPRTRFVYGHALRGERLEIEAPEPILRTHAVYFTFYGRDSFPLMWSAVVETRHETPACEEDGFYVVRVHREARDERVEGTVSVRRKA